METELVDERPSLCTSSGGHSLEPFCLPKTSAVARTVLIGHELPQDHQGPQILLTSGFFLGADDVGETGSLGDLISNVDLDSMRRQILEAVGHRGRCEHQVEGAIRRRQVKHVHVGQEVGIVREGQAFGNVSDPYAGVELSQGRGEPSQILGRAARREVDVVGRTQRRSLRDSCERTDHDIVDTVTIEHLK